MNLRDNIKVDCKQIAEGMYEMFDENEKTALKFGMLPAVKMEILKKQLQLKAKELIPSPEKIFTEAELKEMEFMNLRESSRKLAEQERKEWLAETEHNICLALYDVAPMIA